MNTTNTTDIFKQKALGGYLMCFMNHCPLREQCLHWQVGHHMPQNPPTCICVNPHGEQVATENCKLFRHHGWTQEVHFDDYVEDYAW